MVSHQKMWLAIALTLSACSCEGPPRPTNEVVPAPAHQARALQLLDLVDERDVSITWMTGACLEPTGLPGCHTGIARNGCEIYLIKKFSLRASDFVHELMHCRLHLDTGDADSGHQRGEWRDVAELQRKLWAWEQCVVWRCNEDGGFDGPR